MRSGEIRTVVLERVGRGLAERGGAIGRQRAERNIPALVVQPLLDIAAGARHFERLIVVFQQNDMIGQTTKAAQHHIFIARQALTRPKCCLPLALQDGDVVEHFGIGFPG
jgi:hypothetical protein